MRLASHIFNAYVYSQVGGTDNLLSIKEDYGDTPEYRLELDSVLAETNKLLKLLGHNPLTEKEFSQVINVVFRANFKVEKSHSGDQEEPHLFVILRDNEIYSYTNSTSMYTSPSNPESENYPFLNGKGTGSLFDKALSICQDDESEYDD